MIWRDDDIAVETRGPRLDQLLRVDDCFQQAGVQHTIAVIMDRLDRNPLLIQTIKDRKMRPQLHAWKHEDLTVVEGVKEDIAMAVVLFEEMFGIAPTVLYPPWNRSNATLESIARRWGMTVSTHKISIQQFIRCQGDVAEDTINFHYWDKLEEALLPEALAIYKRRHEEDRLRTADSPF